MSRRERALTMGLLALGCAGAFWSGGALLARSSPAPARTPGTVAGVFAAAADDVAPSPTEVGSSGEVTRLGTALTTALRSHAAADAPAQVYVETEAQRADRRRTVDRHLTEKLGAISASKRAALLEFNDEATQVQLGLQAALLHGALSQADYDAQLHQRIVVQLDQLRALVTDDEYRKLTGLEPGVDPYEYMRTGVGGVPTGGAAVAAAAEETSSSEN